MYNKFSYDHIYTIRQRHRWTPNGLFYDIYNTSIGYNILPYNIKNLIKNVTKQPVLVFVT
jgi:hypothetical protein